MEKRNTSDTCIPKGTKIRNFIAQYYWLEYSTRRRPFHRNSQSGRATRVARPHVQEPITVASMCDCKIVRPQALLGAVEVSPAASGPCVGG